MNPHHCGRLAPALDRRDFLAKSAFGFGASALGWLMSRDLHAATPAPVNPLAPKKPDFPAKAERVIFLFMTGGPSHIDTFDPKPQLQKYDGQSLPESFKSEELPLQFIKAQDAKLMGSPFTFKKHGESGLEVSDLFPRIAEHADRLAVIRSCYHETFIHGPAIGLLHTGSILLGHPSMGAWVTYGLGSVSDNLPAYMVMSDGGFRGGPTVSYGSGFLPAIYQGTVLRTEGAPFQNLTPPFGLSSQRKMLDQVNAWNARFQSERSDDTRLAAQLANYELAFRMQTAAPELIDVAKEPQSIRDLYGIDKEPTKKFGSMCLLARRMAERGVRFIQLYNTDWDGHAECADNHRKNASHVDQPIAALLTDLHQRRLLDSTLVVWLGEFGRTPVMQGTKGRDHNPYGFTAWMAGGGIHGGKTIGETDDFGFRAVEDKIHVNDLHATMLKLLGLDHEKLTFLFAGRKHRLTDVGGYNEFAQRLLA